MKQQFILIGCIETSVLTSAWLSSDGVKTEQESLILGKNLGTFESHLEAISEMKLAEGYEFYKIDMIYINN